MKVLPFKIPKPNDEALVYQVDKGVVFYDKLHQHEEIQVSFVVEGSGTLIVGDSINQYVKNDVIALGGNVPHVFKSDMSSEESVMISLFFTTDSFGEKFFKIEETAMLRPFFGRAENGFKAMSHKLVLREHFIRLQESSKLDRFILLQRILEVLSRCKREPLSTFAYKKNYSDTEGKRMRDVLEYTMTNFSERIKLEHIANIAVMTPNAFCKYFKKRTNKSYMTFLNELRVEQACRLLLDDNDLSIATVAEMSGFNNISNFNRKFKSIKNLSPSHFKAFKKGL